MYVELKNINKTFGDYKASDNVNFGIEKGKLIGLLGPSGSGKTTILRMIAGLENPDSGEIVIDGKVVNDIPASKRGIGFVFQNYALFRYMTVFDNIAFGLKIQKKSKKFIKERVNELVKLIGLEGLEKRYPSQLSGGQKQRVAFARALAPNPNLLLLDEPFAAIDAKVRQELRSWLKDMIERLGVTSIFVTHDQSEAIEVADEIIITNKGRIEQIGSPIDIYQHPETAFSASFFGKTTTLDDYTKLFEEIEAAIAIIDKSADSEANYDKISLYYVTMLLINNQADLMASVGFERQTALDWMEDLYGKANAITSTLDYVNKTKSKVTAGYNSFVANINAKYNEVEKRQQGRN